MNIMAITPVSLTEMNILLVDYTIMIDVSIKN